MRKHRTVVRSRFVPVFASVDELHCLAEGGRTALFFFFSAVDYKLLFMRWQSEIPTTSYLLRLDVFLHLK